MTKEQHPKLIAYVQSRSGIFGMRLDGYVFESSETMAGYFIEVFTETKRRGRPAKGQHIATVCSSSLAVHLSDYSEIVESPNGLAIAFV